MIRNGCNEGGGRWTRLCALLVLALGMAAPDGHASQTTITALPYTASQNNDTLTIAGTKLTSTGSGIEISGDNVVLNLGTDTIVFGSGGGSGTYGIRFRNAVNVTVVGGTILKTSVTGNGAAGIEVSASNNLLLSGTNIAVDGHDAQCVNMEGGSPNTYNCDFNGGVWRNNSESFTSRESYSGAVFYTGSFPATAGSYDVRIRNVNITNGPCQGIIVKGEFVIENCQITTDARNVYWDSVYLWQNQLAPIGKSADNSYLILCRGGEPGTIIRNNVLTSGTQYGGSRGILLENCAGTSAEPIEVYGNTLTIHAGPSGENLGGTTRVIRMRAIDGGQTKFIRVYDNTFIGIGDDDPNTTHIGKDVAVMNFGFPNTSDTCIVERNRFIARSLTTGTKVKACESVYNGTNFQHVVRNNHFIGSSTIIYLGDEYNGISVSGMRFLGDTLSFDSGFTFDRKVWNIGYSGSNSLDNIAIDCKFQNGATDTNINWFSQNGGTNEMTLARTLDILVRGNNALPVSAATVTVTNGYGQTIISGTTNGNGRISGVASYWYASDDNADSTSFNTFTIKTKKGTDSTVSTFSVNATSTSPSPTLANTPGQAGGNTAPTTPTPNSPAANDTVNTTPLAVRVTNSTDADSDPITYDFYISTSATFATTLDSVKNVSQSPTQTQALFSNLSPVSGQRYYWRARAYDGTDYSAYSAINSFWYVSLSSGNECLTPPGTPGLSSPANGGSVTILTPALCVTNSTPAPGCLAPQVYTFQVYADSTLTTLTTSTTTVGENAGGTTCWTLATSLQPGRSYWWRARSTNGQATSNWTATYRFTTPNNPPTTPSPQSPTNGGTVATLQPTLIVNASTDADGTPLTYTFQISPNAAFSTITTSGSKLGQGTQISWSPTVSLTNGNTYYWRCRASDGIANSGWSAARSFVVTIVTNDPPSAPAIASPADGDSANSVTPQLIVNNGNDPNGDPLTYQFELYDASGTTLLTSVSGVAQGGTFTSWTVGLTLTDGQSYRWRARCSDGSLNSSWTSLVTFTVALAVVNNRPSIPSPASPVNNETVTGTPIALIVNNSVDPDSDPIRYDFQLFGDSALGTLLLTVLNVNETAIQTATVLSSFSPTEGERYWWRAQAKDDAGLASGYSSAASFTYEGLSTGGDEYVAGTNWPVDGQTVSDDQPSLRAQNILAAGTNFYYFDVSTDSNFVQSVVSSGPIPEVTGGFTEWEISEALETGITYYWRVRANTYAYSTVASFLVGELSVVAYPNPVDFDQGESVTFDLPSTPVDLLIQTVSGETVLVASNVSGPWTWDGRNNAGNRVAFGVYSWYVSGDASQANGKIMFKPRR